MYEDLMFLDHAAATPVDEVVLKSMIPYFTEHFYNPSSPYASGVQVKREYSDAKQRIAVVLGVQKDELVMTAGATESINIAFTAANGMVAVSAVEHTSVLSAAKKSGTVVKIMPDRHGRITADAVNKSLNSEVGFISIGLVNNELGTVQPIEDIAKVIDDERERRRQDGEQRQLLFHTDASQAAVLIDVKPKRLGVDLMTLSAAKVYGPKQVGLLWVRPGVKVQSTVVGGGQELGLRSGTENVAGVIGFATALDLSSKRRSNEVKRLRSLKEQMQKTLADEFPDMVVSSDNRKSLVSFLNVSFVGLDAERLIFWLEKRGVMVATGSACAANSGTKSHILEAIGLSDEEINGSLRISLGRLSTVENCNQATQFIIEAVKLETARLNK